MEQIKREQRIENISVQLPNFSEWALEHLLI